ncbi:hypothetical protein [Methanococcus voltae]|uniref:Uncharacterized protein n=1 Tax=Methanococcus voltae (strain ATCC BAA-1334 / A3) TaxID=456320 RepID=D7DTG6_METV3|nr:hypothetical protein [Methanococcus voltae]MCS3901278.1 hypothetical protein [Methanococcus voltae]
MYFTKKMDNFIDFKTSFEKPILSKRTNQIIDELGIKPEEIVIGEFAGRDSSAAIIKAFEDNDDVNVILPICAFTGLEYDNSYENSINSQYNRLGYEKQPVDEFYANMAEALSLKEYAHYEKFEVYYRNWEKIYARFSEHNDTFSLTEMVKAFVGKYNDKENRNSSKYAEKDRNMNMDMNNINNIDSSFVSSRFYIPKKENEKENKMGNSDDIKMHKDKIFLPLHFMYEPSLWHAINGRFSSLIGDKFFYYSPCMGCHAYLRMLRIPIANHFGKRIISGDRLKHDDNYKINQIAVAFEVYANIAKDFDVEIISPLKDVEQGTEIKEIINEDWEQDASQFTCMFSKNYRNIDNTVNERKCHLEDIERIYKEYVEVISKDLLHNGYNNSFDYMSIVAKYFKKVCKKDYPNY